LRPRAWQAAGALILAVSVRAASAGVTADRIFVNGSIWTGNPKMPRVQAIAVRGDRILGLGTNADVRKMAEPKTETVDLKGRLVLPGFNDAHVHILSGGLSLATVGLENASSVEEMQRTIGAYAAAHKDSPWVTGRGWVYVAFPGGLPTRKLLDQVVSDRPAFMSSYDGHTGWCNTIALRVAGITRVTPDPPHGVIVRDAQGEPTGVLKEDAQALVEKFIPAPSEEDKSRALKAAFDLFASHGITSVQDARFDPEDLPTFERVIREGGLKVRIYAALPLEKNPSPELLERYKKLREAHRGPLLKFGAVKGFVDGVVEAKTAAMLEPYVGGGSGHLNWTPEELNSTVTLYDREGYQILLHAIGDRAIRVALDAYQEAARKNGPLPRRHRIEHVEVPQPADVQRFKPLGVIASTQAFFANPDKDTLETYSENLGKEREAHAMPFRLLDDSGAVQAFGSDWPVYSCDVLKGIYAAVTRQTPEGNPPGGWHPEQRISTEAAVRHFTRDAAYASFDEGQKGTILPGALADFVVLSENILEGPPETHLKAQVLLTVLAGQDTYRARGF
jgi:predicted amidohydrolase YtcJ